MVRKQHGMVRKPCLVVCKNKAWPAAGAESMVRNQETMNEKKGKITGPLVGRREPSSDGSPKVRETISEKRSDITESDGQGGLAQEPKALN